MSAYHLDAPLPGAVEWKYALQRLLVILLAEFRIASQVLNNSVNRWRYCTKMDKPCKDEVHLRTN